jgi:hypothetical protein
LPTAHAPSELDNAKVEKKTVMKGKASDWTVSVVLTLSHALSLSLSRSLALSDDVDDDVREIRAFCHWYVSDW